MPSIARKSQYYVHDQSGRELVQRLDEAMLEIPASQLGASHGRSRMRVMFVLIQSQAHAAAIQHVLTSVSFAPRDFTLKIGVIFEIMADHNPPRKRYGLGLLKRRHSGHRVSDESSSRAATGSEVWNFRPHNY